MKSHSAKRLHHLPEPLEARIAPAAFTWINPASGAWTTAANWSVVGVDADGIPDADDDVTIDPATTGLVVTISTGTQTANSINVPGDDVLAITGGTLTISAASTVKNLTLSGGTLNAGPLLTLAGTSNFSGNPTLNGAVRNDGALSVANDPNIGGTLDNAGNITITGRLDFTGAGGLNNLASGVVTLANAAGGNVLAGAATVQGFFNSGTLRHTLAVTSTVAAPYTNFAAAIVDGTAGTLSFTSNAIWEGADLRIAAGADIKLTAGSVNLTGTYTGTGGGKLSFAGGTQGASAGVSFTMNATVGFPAGFFEIGANATFAAGTIVNTGVITITGRPDFSGTIDNAGTIIHTAANIDFGVSGRINNLAGGVYQVESGSGTSIANGAAVSGFFNAGTFRYISGATFAVGVPFHNLTGGIIEATGGVINFDKDGTWGNTHFLISAGAEVRLGAGTKTLTGTYTGLGGGLLRLGGGTQGASDGGFVTAGPGGATVNFPGGFFEFSGNASVKVGGVITNLGAMTIAGTPDLEGTIDNAGTVKNIGQLQFAGAGRFNNLPGATFEIAKVGGGTVATGGTTVPGFFNHGTIRLTEAGTSTISVPWNNFAGTKVDVTAGTLAFHSAGTWEGANINIATGSVVTLNTGDKVWTGTYAGTGGGILRLGGGSQGASAGGRITVGAGGATVNFPNGGFEFSGNATLDGGVLINVGKMTFADRPNLNLTVNNTGTMIDLGQIDFSAAGRINNQVGGIFEVAKVAGGAFTSGTSSVPGIFNAGTLLLATNADVSMGTPLSNTGLVKVTAGILRITGVVDQIINSELTGGTWEAGNGTSLLITRTFATNSGTLIQHGTGVISTPAAGGISAALRTNLGSIQLLEGATLTVNNAFTNSGTITLGGGSLLTTTGAFTQTAEGRTEFQIGGTSASGQFGRLAVGGTANLDGAAAIVLVNNFAPLVGDSYSLATFSGKTGAFNYEGTYIQRTLGFAPVLTNTTLVLNTLVSTTDLAVTTVTPTAASGVSGQNFTVDYTVTNLENVATTANSWVDSFYLSKDDTYDSSDLLLGRVTHNGIVAGNGSYSGSFTGTLPGVLPGNYRVLVIADSRGLSPDANRANNTLASTPVTTDVPALTSGVAVNGTILPGQDLFFKLDVAGGATPFFNASYGAAGAAELYLGQRFIPTQSHNDDLAYSPAAVTAQVTGSSTIAGTYYVTLHGREAAGAGGTSYSLMGADPGFAITSLDHPTGANVGQLTTTVHGSLFKLGTTFSIALDGGTAIPAANVIFQDSTTAFVTFNLNGLALGAYDVIANNSGAITTLADSLHVITGTPGELKINITSPRYIRPIFGGVHATLTYENTGDTDLVAPLLTVTGDGAKMHLRGTEGYTVGSIELLAINPDGLAGILAPGAKGEFIIDFEPLVVDAHSFTTLTARVAGYDGTLDWSLLEDDLQPVSIEDDAWSAIYGNFVSTIGSTFDEYHAMLSENATYLAQLGHRTGAVSTLMNYELLQAGAFGGISKRYDQSVFGRGLSGPFDVRAFILPPQEKLGERAFRPGPIVVNGANAVIAGQPYQNIDDIAGVEGNVVIQFGANVRSFISLAPNEYVGVPGETGTLAKLPNGQLELRELNGLRMVFRASDGRLDFIEDPAGNRTTAAYDGAGQITTLTETDGDVTNYAYNGQGRIATVTDAVGRVTNLAYDASGEHLLTVTDASGTIALTYVTGQGAAREHAISSVTFPDGSHRFYTYDTQGRLSSSEIDGGQKHVTYAYDSAGTVTATDAAGNSTSYFRNANGQVSRIVDPLLQIVTNSFDPLTGLFEGSTFKNATGLEVTYQNGLLSGIVGADGEVTAFKFGGAINRLQSLTDPRGSTTNFAYDDAANLTSTTNPVGGVIGYTYDSEGRRTSWTTESGTLIGYTYDAHGLVIFKDLPGTANDVTYSYNAHRNLDTVSSAAAGTTDFDYDAADRLTKVTYPNGKSLSYSYHAGGRRASITDQDGFSVQYTNDSAGRLDLVKDQTGATLVDNDYDALGRLMTETKGNGTTTTYVYDQLNRVASITHRAPGGAVIESFAYTYDAVGKVIEATSSVTGTTSYGYDLSGQLTSVELPGGRAITYAYDLEGSRTVVTDSLNGVTNYNANTLDQYATVGAASFTYSPEGNLLTNTGGGADATYTYDPEGRIVSAVTTGGNYTYQYDALGNRIGVTHNGANTAYLVDPTGFGNVFAEYGAGGALVAHYAQGFGLASRIDAGGQAEFYHYDVTGNTQLLTGAGGAVVSTYEYLPFGEKTASTGASANPFTFNGRVGVKESGNGLYDMRARVYDPQLGRFLQDDPIGFAAGDTNLQRFVRNDPVNRIDPSGLRDNYAAAGAELTIGVGGTVQAGLAYDSETGFSDFGPFFTFGVTLGFNGGLSGVVGSTPDVTGAAQSVNFGGGPVTASVQVDEHGNVIGGAGGYSAKFPGGVSHASTYTFQLTPNSFFTSIGLGKAPLEPTLANSGLNNARVQQFVQTQLDDPLVNAVAKRIMENTSISELEAAIRARMLVNNYRRNLTTTSETITPNDPNNIIGPNGVGADPLLDVGIQPERFEGFITTDGSYDYTIQFENKPNASAPAQVVFVTQQLDTDLDFSTFQLGDFGFGSVLVQVPNGLTSYSTRIDATAILGVLVDFNASVDLNPASLTYGLATWTLTSIDPNTGDIPLDPFAGFLPANVAKPNGEGFLTYSIQPKANLVSGTVIDGQATIYFDTNAPIATPLIHNIIDSLAPVSAITPFATPTSTRGTFRVTFAGGDENGGSGFGNMSVFYRDNGGALQLLVAESPGGAVRFSGGQVGHTYTFFSTSVDLAGNSEAIAATPDATLTVVVPTFLDVGKKRVFTDADGDTYTVTHSGPGTTKVALLDPDGDGKGAIDFIQTDSSTTKSKVTITVKKNKNGGDGIANIGDAIVNGALGAFTAKASDFVFNGITATGPVKTIAFRDALRPDALLVDPHLTLGGTNVDKLLITARHLADGIAITTPGILTSLTAASIGDGSITAAALGKMTTTLGAMNANMTIAGAVGVATIKGGVNVSQWTVGSIGAVTIGGTLEGDIDAGTTIKSVTVKNGALNGQLTGATIGAVSVTGGGFGGFIGSSAAPGKVKGLASLTIVGGDLSGSVLVNGNSGPITVKENKAGIGGNISGPITANSFGAITLLGGGLSGALNATGTALSLGKTPALAKLTVTGGDILADVRAFGGAGAISVKADKPGNGGNITDINITAAKIASLTVARDITDSIIMAGADLGADREIGGTGLDADTYGPGTIGAVNIGSKAGSVTFGNVVNTVIAAGLSTTNTIFKDGDDTILGVTPAEQLKNRIASLIIKGSADPASYFAAGKFKVAPKIGTTSPDVTTDARFLVT